VSIFLVATALPVGLAIYTAFVQAAPIHVKFAVRPYLFLLTVLILILAAPFLFTRSVGCKRVMFRPTLNLQKSEKQMAAIDTSEQWDVYQFEKEAFRLVGVSSPSEWETRFWVRGLVLEFYILIVFIPLLFTSALTDVIELVVGTLALSALIAGISVIADAGGIIAFIQSHRNGQTLRMNTTDSKSGHNKPTPC
jgi:hypothetical protein